MVFDKALLKRDDKYMHNILTDTSDGISISKEVHIVFPERFLSTGLAEITSIVEVAGVVLVMDESHKYTVMSLPNLLSFVPNSIESIKINNKPHTIMGFTPPHFIDSKSVLDTDDIAVQIIDEFIISNHCPFYTTTSDLITTLNKIPITTASRVIFSPIASELLAMLAIKDNNGNNARAVLNKEEMDDIDKISIIGIGNVASFTNNISRITGGYFGDGLTYGIADENPEETELDNIFRL